MFSVPHLVVLFIVVLVFFGPHKLPELARGLGKLMAEFRKASSDFKMAFEEEMRNIERQTRENEWKKSQEEAEAKRTAELAGSEPNSGSVTEPKVLPESPTASATEVIEPIVAPVSEAVARGSQVAETTASETVIDVPAEEAPSSDNGASSAPDASNASSQPHDQRQPA
jgi:sec-independent protein translocase protein TatB